MSVLLALLLAADPATAAATQPVQKQQRMRCEWIHEVGTSRPRRVCEKRQPKAEKPAATAAPQQAPQPSEHQHETAGQ